jgi:hypothetical protein
MHQHISADSGSWIIISNYPHGILVVKIHPVGFYDDRYILGFATTDTSWFLQRPIHPVGAVREPPLPTNAVTDPKC